MKNFTSEQLLEIRDNPNVQKFMNIIGTLESNNQYNVIFGGEIFNDFSKHPNKVGGRTADGLSTAAGRYQFIYDTFTNLVNKNPQADINDFSPESQDKAFLLLLAEQGVLEDVMQGGKGHTRAIENLGTQFTSLPSSVDFYKQGGAKSYVFLNKQFGVPFPTPPVDPEPRKISKKDIVNTDMSIVSRPFEQENPYEVASALTFLADTQTDQDRVLLQQLGIMNQEPINYSGDIKKFFKEEPDIDVMKAMELPSMEGVKKFNKRQ